MTCLRKVFHAYHMLRTGTSRLLAPLATARGGDSMYWDDPAGQRRFQRIPMYREPADLYVQYGGLRAIIGVQVLDLSGGGARISTAELPPVAATTEVTLTAPLPGGGYVPGIRAHLVWVQRGLVETTAGLEFIAIAPADRRRIQAAIDAVAEARLSA